MAYKTFKSVACITSASILLTACSSGSDEQSRYATLTSTEDRVSELGGAGINRYQRDGKGFYGNAIISGQIDHGNKIIDITSNDLTIIDENGFDRYGNISHNGITLTNETRSTFDAQYDYVNYYYYENPSDQIFDRHLITAGIITREDDVPTDGTAVYHGEAAAIYQHDSYADTFHYLNEGTSTVTANFGSGLVTAELSNFASVQDSDRNALSDSLIDSIIVRDMEIRENTFFGRDIEIYKDGVEINFIASSGSGRSHGAFFGYDENNQIPDEVGGVIYTAGSDSYVEAVYLAD